MNISDYLVNIRCPHCNRNTIAAISGFGGELAIREKECKVCKKPYFVHILATATKEKEITDGQISGMRLRIKYLKEQHKITKAELLVKTELAQKVLQESLEAAKEMRRKNNLN